MRRIVVGVAMFVLAGAGCVSDWRSDAVEMNAEDVDVAIGASVKLEPNWPVFGERKYGIRDVTIDEWAVGQSGKISWSTTVSRETASSKEARANASNDIGAEPLPVPVYEDVVIAGSLKTDAFNNASRIYLPSYWPEGEVDVSGDENSVIWISRQQYDELVDTRSSHLQLGLFDTTLQSAVEFSENAENALNKLQGKIAEEETSNKDFTKLEANGDWGTYDLVVNGENVRVKTIEAKNVFGSYVILANPENPMILKASIRPWALGFGMLTTLAELKEIVGYQVTEVTIPSAQPSEGQQQPVN